LKVKNLGTDAPWIVSALSAPGLSPHRVEFLHEFVALAPRLIGLTRFGCKIALATKGGDPANPATHHVADAQSFRQEISNVKSQI
jgi:hypothetical protein